MNGKARGKDDERQRWGGRQRWGEGIDCGRGNAKRGEDVGEKKRKRRRLKEEEEKWGNSGGFDSFNHMSPSELP